MEYLASILEALRNNYFGLILLSVIIIGFIYGVRKGVIKFNNFGLNIDASERELTIVRNQMQYVNTTMDATIRDLPSDLEYYRIKYIISKVKDEFETIIIYNHIKDNSDYIELKQEIIYNLIMKLTDNEFFRKPEFKDYIYDLVDKIIRRLVKIRQQYS